MKRTLNQIVIKLRGDCSFETVKMKIFRAIDPDKPNVVQVFYPNWNKGDYIISSEKLLLDYFYKTLPKMEICILTTNYAGNV